MLRCLLLVLMLAAPAGADPLDAAGRLENPDTGGGCSAVLVEPDVVLTAAHCVPVDGVTNSQVFRLGDALNHPPTALTARAIHPLYGEATSRTEWRFRFDLAAVRLAEPVPPEVATPIEPGPEARVGERLFLLSWKDRTRPRPRQRACEVIPGIRGLITLACDVRSGESGAPVVRKTDDGVELVGIVSSRSRQFNQPTAQASNVWIRLAPLLDILE